MKKTLVLVLILILSVILVSCRGADNDYQPADGDDGKSAYELAVENGYEGTVEEWLASLVGEAGAPGKSAYEVAVKNGYEGSEGEWLESLVGAKGDKGEKGDDGITPELKIGEDNYWYVSYDNGATWKSLNVKATGDKGEQGDTGNEGLSAYEIYKKYHTEYTGTEYEWICDLINGKLGEKKTHTVRFDSGCDTIVEAQTVISGEKATAPQTPEKDGYVFDGWYYGEEKWSFIGFVVTEDMTLVAKWIEAGTLGLEYYPLPDGTYGVMADNTQHLETIMIPSSYNGVAVTQILPNAFKDAVNLKTLKIPNTVSVIGEFAFENCLIENITMPLLALDHLAKSEFVSVTITSGTIIPKSAFSGCSKLKKVLLPSSIITIETNAFRNCTALETFVVPNGVTNINNWAFRGCSSLKTLVMPQKATVGSGVFTDCTSLNFSEYGNALYLGTNDNPYAYLVNEAREDITYCTLHEDARIICGQALVNTPIESLVLNDKLELICDHAFGGCDNLKAVHISNLESWFNIRFEATNPYTSIPFTLGAKLYVDGELVTELIVPESVTEIKPYAFAFCNQLVSVTFHSNIEKVGEDAFSRCDKLVEVINRSSIDVMQGSNAKPLVVHSGDSKIVNKDGYMFISTDEGNYLVGYIGDSVILVLPKNFNGEDYSIYQYAFYLETKYQSIVIPDAITEIGDYAFYNCSSITEIELGNGVASVGKYAFQHCTNIEKVVIPGSVKTVGYAAFYGCTSIKELIICNGVQKIDSSAFNGCTKIVGVVIPDSVTNIGSYAFEKCTSLETVTLSSNIDRIAAGIFRNCINLDSIILPHGVTAIDSCAFQNCSSLSNITIPLNVTKISIYAFENCTSLTSFTIPNGVAKIDIRLFAGCTNLKTVVVPNTVTEIKGNAFLDCPADIMIYYKGTEAGWSNITVESGNTCLNVTTIYYYKDSNPGSSGNYWHYVDEKPTNW